MPPSSDDVTTCVRRFGRATRGPGESRGYEHITGARMATTNGHEVSRESLAEQQFCSNNLGAAV